MLQTFDNVTEILSTYFRVNKVAEIPCMISETSTLGPMSPIDFIVQRSNFCEFLSPGECNRHPNKERKRVQRCQHTVIRFGQKVIASGLTFISSNRRRVWMAVITSSVRSPAKAEISVSRRTSNADSISNSNTVSKLRITSSSTEPVGGGGTTEGVLKAKIGWTDLRSFHSSIINRVSFFLPLEVFPSLRGLPMKLSRHSRHHSLHALFFASQIDDISVEQTKQS